MNRLSFQKVFYHLDHLNMYLEAGDCYPVHIIVGLTNVCNHRCIWCYGYDTISTQYNENAFAPPEMITKTIREAAELGLRSITLVGTGEPTLHREFPQIVREIKAAGVEIGLFTNGSRLSGEVARAVVETHTFIRLSCSAADTEEHNLIHHAERSGNDFDRIVANIRALQDLRGANPFPTVGVQFAVGHQNYQSIVRAAELWKGIGVDYFELKPVYKHPSAPESESNRAPLDEVRRLMAEAQGLSDEGFEVYAKFAQFDRVLAEPDQPRGYSKCHGQAFTTFLDPDGKLYVCGNHHGRQEFSLGNVNDSGSFKAVWEGEQRQRLLQRLKVAGCPVGCRMDPLNRIIEDLIEPDPESHPNFL